MSKTTLVWVLTYAMGLLASFVNPAFGAFTYLVEYYWRPALHWWGDPLPSLRYNLIAATVLAVAYLIRRRSLKALAPPPRGPVRYLLLLAGLMLAVTMFWSVDATESWRKTQDYLKLILFCGLVIGTIRTEWAFDVFVGLHMAGAGWWGWEAYQNPRREAGRLYAIGSGDTLGDNFAAAHLLTVLPFVIVYLLVHKDKRLRGLALVVAPFVINALILCNSRGSMVGLFAAGSVALLISRTGHRLRMVGASVLFAGALFALADPEFIARQQTTVDYEDDGSANERLASWKGGFELIRDYPFGAGGTGYEALSPVYISAIVDAHHGERRAPHNTLVLVASEWGVLGFILFVVYHLSCFRLLGQVRARAPEGGIWYYRSVAIQLGMVGLLVAGMFSDRLYAEAPYWMGALTVVLHRLQTEDLAGAQSGHERLVGDERPTNVDLHPAAAMIMAQGTR